MSNEILQRADAASIERELRELWKDMAAKSQSLDVQAVTRACTHNLAIYAPGEDSLSELGPLLADLSESEPGRVFLMLSKPEASQSLLTAYVSAQCHLTSGKRQQVCSEQIVVRAEGKEIRNLPSLVIPLIVPDLPVYLWWRSDLSAEWMHFREFVELADRVIVDSARFAQPRESLRKLHGIMTEISDVTAFSDLNWNRLTPLREMTAGFFDHPGARTVLPAITKIDIQAVSPSGFSIQSFLYSAWLAARLQWRPVSISPDGSEIVMKTSEGQVRISMFVRPPGERRLRGISSVTLHSEQPQAGFHISFDPDTRHLRSTAEAPWGRIADRTIRAALGSEEECLASELGLLGHDRVYEETMRAAASLL